LIAVDTTFKANDLEVGYEDSTATHITLNGSSIEVSGDGASAKDGVLTISSEGTYVIAGTLTDGQIVVDAKDSDKLQIVLNGVSITCADNAPIYIKNADKVYITLAEGTENTLTDKTEYVQTDDNTVDGVIFSEADLTLNGEGTLNITANYKHGIVSKDALAITGGIYNITAIKDTINGKDCVKINDGTFTLSSETGNGISSKNKDDETKGYVYIKGGNITIVKCREGIEGTAIIIENGTIDITSSDDGFNAANGYTSATNNSVNNADPADATDAADTTDTTATTLASYAEAASVTVAELSSETDANSSATVPEDGTNDSSLGGGNLGGGNFGDGNFGGGKGGGAFENDTNCYISISGGTINVNASGDGIDSNGSLYISGGTIYVSGPTESGNGAIDYNGTADITGGTIVAAGSSGMAEGFSDTSTQYSLLNNFSTAIEAGTEIKLTDKDGNVIASFTPAKQYQSVVISSPKLTKDESYTLTCGDQTANLTLTSIVTSNGEQQMGGFGKGGQGVRPDRGNFQKPGTNNSTDSTTTPQ
jgi:hypothetical protein